MRKIILLYGIPIGLAFIANFFLMAPSSEDADYTTSEWVGYTVMIVGLGSIFFAVKQYRDKELGGKIKFGQAFLLGLYITLVASFLYVLGWELYLNSSDHSFADQYLEQIQQGMRNKGMTEAEIETELAPQMGMIENYKNNVGFRMFITFVEIFPVGLIVSLICGLIFGVFLKKKDDDTLAPQA